MRRLHADGEAFFAAAERDPAADVQGCPGWNVDKLVGHLGRIHTWAAQVVRSRTTEPISSRLFPEGPDDPTLRLRWARERHAELLDALSGLGEDEPLWIWSPEGTGPGRFWLRRQAQEMALHRWDAQRATGEPEPLDGELAADGVEELFAVFLPPGDRTPTRAVSSDGGHPAPALHRPQRRMAGPLHRQRPGAHRRARQGRRGRARHGERPLPAALEPGQPRPAGGLRRRLTARPLGGARARLTAAGAG